MVRPPVGALPRLDEPAGARAPAREPWVALVVDDDPEGQIRVSDRGVGIEPRHLERIFEPFQRLHPPAQFPGVGIGLAICRKIAQLHGGSIRAQSVPGTGTTMIVTLPAAG